MKQGNFIDDLAKCLADATKHFQEAMPSSVREAQKDLAKNYHAILQNAFAKLDLVTREEFDVQAKVLAKTRHKLETLEKHITELEHKKRSQSTKTTHTTKTKKA